jgi:hypothetical protein
MVEDSLLLSEGEVSMEGSKSTVIVVWLVNHSSPSDAPLTEFHERHPYLLRVIRSVITKDPQLSLVPSSALTQEPLGFSHAEGVPEVGAMGITTQVADLNLFEHVKQQIKTLVEKPYDPLVISVRPPEAKRSNLPRGIRAQPAPTKESSLSSEQLSPQQAAQELITFFIDSFCSNDNLASIGKVVKQFEPIASALKEASSPSTLRDKLRTQLTEALPKDVDVQQATAQLDKKIDELRARVKVEQEGAKSGLQQVIEEMV